jgi:hypothetical protein
MANVTLPRPQSQARSIAPTQSYEAPTALQQVIGALPGLANAAVRAYSVSQQAELETAKLAQQEALNTQRIEDQGTLATATSEVNLMLANRESAQLAETNMQSLAMDLNRALADGELSEADVKIQQTFLSTFNQVKGAKEQGLLSDNAFSIRAREAKQKMLAQYPHLAGDIDKIYNTATGRQASAVSGAAAQKELLNNRSMEAKYGVGYTASDVQIEAVKRKMAEDIVSGKDIGTTTFGRIVADSNSALNLGIDSISTKAATLYSGKQALDQNDLDTFNSQIEQVRRAYVNGIDEDIASVVSKGGIIDPSAVRSQKEYGLKQLDDIQLYINDKDLQKMLEKRKTTQNLMWENGLGGQITKLNSIASTLGQGGMTALSGFISASTPAQEQVMKSFANEAGLTDNTLADTKQLVLDAASRVANPTPPPGFEKLDAFYGLGAISSGTTSPTVELNTLRNLNKLVKTPQDVSGAIRQLNNPKVSLTYGTAGKAVKDELTQTLNAWESTIFKAVEDGGYTVSYNNASEKLIVSKEGGGNLPVSLLGLGGGFGSSLDTRVTLNGYLTETMNAILATHKNPNYTSILQPPVQWINEVTNLFQPTPIPPSDLNVSE